MDKNPTAVAENQAAQNAAQAGARSAAVSILIVILVFCFAYIMGLFDGLISRRINQGKFDAQIAAAIASGRMDEQTRDRFVRLSRDRAEFKNRWMGVEIRQFGNDLQLYQELIHDVKPDVIVETGTFAGGMTLWMAMLMEHIHPDGKIITVDIDSGLWDETLAKLALPPERKEQLLKRIHFIKGSSTDPEVLKKIAAQITPQNKVMVLLDSLHTKDHVFNELKLYSPLVSPGSYLIVNDTDLDGVVDGGVPGKDIPGYNEAIGVKAAVDEWLPANPAFVSDTEREKFMQSCCRNGMLKRTK